MSKESEYTTLLRKYTNGQWTHGKIFNIFINWGNENQNHLRYYIPSGDYAFFSRNTIKFEQGCAEAGTLLSCCGGCEWRNLHDTLFVTSSQRYRTDYRDFKTNETELEIFGKQLSSPSNRLNTECPWHPAIPPQGTLGGHSTTCAQMFTAALFTGAPSGETQTSENRMWYDRIYFAITKSGVWNLLQGGQTLRSWR